MGATELEPAIHAASRWVDRYKGRDFVYHNHSSSPLVLRGSDRDVGERVVLPALAPIITLTKVEVNDEEWIAGTDFYQEEDFALHAINRYWPQTADGTVKLTGTFGYPERAGNAGVFDAPSNIARATIMMAAAISGHMRKDVLGLDGNIQSIADRDVPKPVRDLLGPPVVRV